MSYPHVRWIVPILVFVEAATLAVVLRDDVPDPRPVRAADDVSHVIVAPRLGDVPDLPKPLATPTPPPRRARVQPTASTAAAPGPEPVAAPAPAATAPAVSAPAPAEPVAAPSPDVAAPQPAPVPSFEDAGGGPVFDDSGPAP
jgi:hypothetical protein